MSAYAFYIQTCREEHRQQNPDTNIIFKEFSRKCADRWKVSVVASIFLPCAFTMEVSTKICYITQYF